ncbi:MAG TPA: ATP-binding protein [Methylocella sp.]|nr:ATP-binding protein [Methylocella sp.]
MSLRLRLICLIALVLALSLAVEGAAVVLHAARSVQTEMKSALQVGRQVAESALKRIPESPEGRRRLQELVASFEGSRHLRVSLTGNAASAVKPPSESPYFGKVPQWFVRLLGIAPLSERVPVTIAGQDYGSILIETDPGNEIVEVWNALGDSLAVLGLFFGASIFLIYYFIGRALQPLERLSGALVQVSHGDYAMITGKNPVPELLRLQQSFNRMACKLADLDREQRCLTERLLTLQEEERKEIARDLHDEISPFLFSVNADLAAIAQLSSQGRGGEIAGQIQSTLDAVSHMQRQIRVMLNRLRPAVLDDFGLAAGIMSLVEFWRRRRPGIRILVHLPPDEASFGPLIDVAIYRIVQESLSNAIRHGDPAEISVSVTRSVPDGPESGSVTVEVANDGHRMADEPGHGLGLKGMRERVHALGGQLVLARGEGLGVAVMATFPCPAKGKPVRGASNGGSA